MYVERTTVKIGNKQHECFMLRESYREDGKVKKRTIANISHLPMAQINALKVALRCKEPLVPMSELSMQAGKIVGTITVVHEIAKKLGIVESLKGGRNAALSLWLIFARLVEQGSRLSSVRLSQRHDASLLGLKSFDEDDLYDALEWLSTNQEDIQQFLFRKRYGNEKPRLFLYDVSSSYLEGTENSLATWGYNRDRKKGKMQVVFGLLTEKHGEPIAIEVFKGNTADTTTFAQLVKNFGKRFGVEEVVMVGDRGMIKQTGIDALGEENFKYITAITKPQIETLLKKEIIQLSLFDSDLHEVTDNGVRYIFRKNPVRANEISKARKEKLERIMTEVAKQNTYLAEHPKALVECALERVQAMSRKLKIRELVKIEAAEGKVNIAVNEQRWQEESQLDGCYVLKTDTSSENIDAKAVHARYKDLAKVERGFRTIKTGLLEVRPIWLRDEAKTRGHIFVCMLAYMISRELEKLTHPEESVQELIAELNTVMELKITVGNEVVTSIPKPRDRVVQIASQIGIKFETNTTHPTKKILPKSA